MGEVVHEHVSSGIIFTANTTKIHIVEVHIDFIKICIFVFLVEFGGRFTSVTPPVLVKTCVSSEKLNHFIHILKFFHISIFVQIINDILHHFKWWFPFRFALMIQPRAKRW